jgi:8-oxo-dGTP pyrophosphatase MutT (NUDIX family)
MLSKTYGKPLRDEMYPVVLAFNDTPLAEIDRYAIPFFGLCGFGVHANGYVKKQDGLYVWVGKRAKDRQIEPGKLDNILGGGLPIGLSVEENLYKEAKEEAGIEQELARNAVFVKTINYRFELEEGIRNDSIFVYDLELDENFTPHNTDGEVEEFRLMPAAEVANLIADNNSFKFNCGLIVADFLLRRSA